MLITDISNQFEALLNDFHYEKSIGLNTYEQPFDGGRKIVLLKLTSYPEGVLLEVQLAIQNFFTESLLSTFQNKIVSSEQIKLTYWQNLASINANVERRLLIQNKVMFDQILIDVEKALVATGFHWLDELSNLEGLKNEMHSALTTNTRKDINIYYLTLRLLILHHLLKNSINDALFYQYGEILQMNRIPDFQLEEFCDFRNFLKNYSI